ncbi:MAG: 16S rRNA (guanine(966)-N(2))-methyltransferase RsmD [Desulfosarcina sp.]|nr:16S rRNA (guanine(966)-N(2))-methyltransferase RsmD [Desulfobacterales bacterium]
MTLRIIGGNLKGRRLDVMRGSVTRPTADRLREAIFNILYTRIQGAVVLDLFAGTGAMGIEALSRDAEYAVFIDNNRNACSVIKKNIISCGIDDTTTIIKRNALKRLDWIKSIRPWFNIVFIDPPYNRNFIKPSLKNLVKSRLLKKEACIIVEHSDSEFIPEEIEPFITIDKRKYGKSMVTFLQYL